uniref:thrombopoietin receptor isoform X2 n=1 Tax=Gasterosteus aculeatus aculeatus TaxID=481459 RepID=UPI001A97F00A|nr:thrombopoietin receptor isoform X2 [Gasterosteus aculeatus aculeatus]
MYCRCRSIACPQCLPKGRGSWAERSWAILLISVWIQVGFVAAIHYKDGTASHLSSEDVLLLKDEKDPKCFTRTEKDFTCFFESANNRTHDLFYKFDSHSGEKRCEMSVQRTDVGTLLHICSFPGSDVFLFVEIHLEVVERNTNTSLYSRTLCVEEHHLLDPPFSVSLLRNGRAGQLQVSWQTNVPKYCEDDMMSRIQYSSKGLGEQSRETKDSTILDSLVPGEEVDVQVTIKCAYSPNAGHWSSWSHPVRAMVPQSADDISLTCFTSDLQRITCRWHGSRYGQDHVYKLSYKITQSEVVDWTQWTECLAEENVTEVCHFRGEEFKRVRVKLASSSAPHSRTFYSPEFTLRSSVKTSPPHHLKATLEKDKLCLKWEAPLLSLSAHLQYEVSYLLRDREAWITMSSKGPETGTCLEVPAGSHYSVKFRAKPNGSIYSGFWSDWSNVLTGDTPADTGALLMLCIAVLLLIVAIVFIAVFSTQLGKLKLYFWPPVPNLDKVLQGFLTEVNGAQWNPPITAKQFSEETTSSLVEIMSEDKDSQLGKPSGGSNRLPSLGRPFRSEEKLSGSLRSHVTFPDYVTLNKDCVVLCPPGNKYVYKEVGEKESPEMCDELFQICHSSCTDGPVGIPTCAGRDLLNRSYLPPAGPADGFHCKVVAPRGPGNLYTNFPCS